jgi:Domain of unknown function (DUF4136)
MKIRIHLLCLALLAASMQACASAKIGYDYDAGVNFSGYHVYDWAPEEQEKTGDRRIDNAQVDIRIRSAIGAQLRRKGYTTSIDAKPDFYVAYHVGVKDLSPDVSTQYYSDGMAGKAFSHSADTRSQSEQTTSGEAQSYHSGTFLVDIIDAGSKQVVWRGTAAGEIESGLTSRERDERLRGIVHSILSHFPPQ